MEQIKKGLHFPVLLREVIDYLKLETGNIILDATLGGGGHALECLKRISPGGRLIAIDRDPEAIERVKKSLKEFDGQIVYINDNFRNIHRILQSIGIRELDGAIFDLGLSSFQIDEGRRGFSFLRDGPLDMRFDTRQSLSAQDVVNKFSREELADIIKKYGEERYAKLLAGAIISARKKKRIETTKELTDIIVRSIGQKYRRQRLHPAARTFQALRIYINDELASVREAVTATISYLKPGARINVISFHSLEDRIIKRAYKDMAEKGRIKIITKKPVSPARREIETNPRARSAKLRVAERVWYEST